MLLKTEPARLVSEPLMQANITEPFCRPKYARQLFLYHAAGCDAIPKTAGFKFISTRRNDRISKNLFLSRRGQYILLDIKLPRIKPKIYLASKPISSFAQVRPVRSGYTASRKQHQESFLTSVTFSTCPAARFGFLRILSRPLPDVRFSGSTAFTTA